jgi:flavin reductase (DIM6/NTAB) family NADH-FMN oxidoreductase RutF
MRRIEPAELRIRPFQLLDQEWALLAAGHPTTNLMTVSWGGFGTLWDRPVVTVYVRPVRHTFGLLNDHAEFTLNFLPPQLRPALDLCGSRSGREIDKWRATKLSPASSREVRVPRVAEAILAIECRILATLDIDPRRFIDRTVDEFYPERDYHRAFIGQVVAVWAGDGLTGG